ncbi:MAG: O-antigen ligase C-terminal domain-containing protein [Ottowia sp.]|nr:O-antigen ligase C-terminal domain-containing protein [Ottowia sp.]
MPLQPAHAVLAALLALPWLWPFTSGPSAAVEPYLVAAAVAVPLLALWPRRAPDGGAAVAASGWLAAALLSSLIGLLQYFHLEAPFYPWINQAVPGQAFGNLRQPNQLATLLVIGLLALRWWCAHDARLRPLAGALAALLLAALAATASRVGLTELLLLGALVLWWARAADQRGSAAEEGEPGAGWRRLALVAAAVLVVYVLAALVLPWALQSGEGQTGRDLVERLQHAESTCGSRLILWSNVLHLISLKPLTGWGWGELAWAHYITLFDGPRFCHILDNAHNLPLHLAVELGVPVAVLACALAAWLVWRGRPWAETDATRQLAWGVLGAIALHSMVEYPLWYGPFQIAALVSVWLLWHTRRRPARVFARSSAAPDTGHSAVIDGARWLLAALLLAATAYAAWDYRRVSQLYLPESQRLPGYRDDTLAQAQKSWLFGDAVLFAEITMREPSRANAAWMLPAALLTLHFSPEPRVIARVIESATWLGLDDLALVHLARFKAAFPKEYKAWSDGNRQALDQARALLAAASAAPASSAGGTAGGDAGVADGKP